MSAAHMHAVQTRVLVSLSATLAKARTHLSHTQLLQRRCTNPHTLPVERQKRHCVVGATPPRALRVCTSSSQPWLHMVLEMDPICVNMPPEAMPLGVCHWVHPAHLHSWKGTTKRWTLAAANKLQIFRPSTYVRSYKELESS